MLGFNKNDLLAKNDLLSADSNEGTWDHPGFKDLPNPGSINFGMPTATLATSSKELGGAAAETNGPLSESAAA